MDGEGGDRSAVARATTQHEPPRRTPIETPHADNSQDDVDRLNDDVVAVPLPKDNHAASARGECAARRAEHGGGFTASYTILCTVIGRGACGLVCKDP